jgi:hypothetical protein
MAHDMHAPTIFTLRSGIAQGRMVYIGVGGDIDAKVNPTPMVHRLYGHERTTSPIRQPDLGDGLRASGYNWLNEA